MTTDNEHLALRRRVEARLGRSAGAAAWKRAAANGFLDDRAHETAEDDLVDYLWDILLFQDDIRRRVPRKRGPGFAHDVILRRRGPRMEALSRLAVQHASADVEVLRFRRRLLGGEAPMSADEVEAYLDSPGARGRPRLGRFAGERTEILEYENRLISHSLHVYPRSPLDQLRRLAAGLAESYPWQTRQAAAFVLEGFMPLASPLVLSFSQKPREERPRRAKIVMEIDLWVPAADVVRAYRDLQRQVLPRHNRPVGERSIELVNFVVPRWPAPWPDLLRQWNNEHPAKPYADYRRLRTAYLRACESLLHPRYRTYLGRRSR